MFLLRIAGAFVFGRAVKLVIRNRDYDTSGLWVVLKELKLCRSLSSRVEAVKASVALWGPCWLGLVRTGLEVSFLSFLSFLFFSFLLFLSFFLFFLPLEKRQETESAGRCTPSATWC